MLTSQMCAHAVNDVSGAVGLVRSATPGCGHPDSDDPKPLVMHRKMWEARPRPPAALDERGMLESGRRGLGFGVGLEPLVALFAAELGM